jgi:hypothetical protein
LSLIGIITVLGGYGGERRAIAKTPNVLGQNSVMAMLDRRGTAEAQPAGHRRLPPAI